MAKIAEKDALQEAITEYNASVNNSNANSIAGAGWLEREVYVHATSGGVAPINRLTYRGRLRGAVADGISVANTYATWNPIDKNTNISLSGGNLIAINTLASNWTSLRANQGKSSGKWVFEITTSVASNDSTVGFGNATFDLATGNVLGISSLSLGHRGVFYTGTGVTSFGTSPANTTSPRMLALDLTTGNGWLIIGNVVANGGDPAAGTSPTFTWAAGTTIFPAGGIFDGATTLTFNAGASAFSNTVPSGFNAGWFI